MFFFFIAVVKIDYTIANYLYAVISLKFCYNFLNVLSVYFITRLKITVYTFLESSPRMDLCSDDANRLAYYYSGFKHNYGKKLM